MKKLSILLFLFPLISFSSSFNQTFQDVDPSRGDYPYIENLVKHWIIDQWIIFRPDDLITRAELSKVVILSSHWVAEDKIRADFFPDVKSSDWYWPFVQSAKYFRMVDGYPDWEFKPWRNINRAEAIKIIYNINKLPYKRSVLSYKDIDKQWYIDYAYSAFAYWIYRWKLNSNWNPVMIFDAATKITRWEMAVYLSKALALSTYYK